MYVVATVLCRWVRVGENNTPVQKLEVNWNYKCEITVWGASSFFPVEEAATHPEDRDCFSWSHSSTSEFIGMKT